MNYISGRTPNKAKVPFSADEINEYFANITSDNNYSKPVITKELEPEPPEFSLHQVYYSLKKIKRTTPGHDNLPHWIFSQNAHNLASPVHHIYNQCLKPGIFPEVIKTSRVLPLPKTLLIDKLDKLRPISITPILSRNFERLIYDCFISATYNRHLRRNQFGFRKSCSTEQALLSILNICKESQKKGFDYVRIFALDLSKAFDRVCNCTFGHRHWATPCFVPYHLSSCPVAYTCQCLRACFRGCLG